MRIRRPRHPRRFRDRSASPASGVWRGAGSGRLGHPATHRASPASGCRTARVPVALSSRGGLRARRPPARPSRGGQGASGCLRRSGKQVVDGDSRVGAGERRDVVAGRMTTDAAVAVFSRIAVDLETGIGKGEDPLRLPENPVHFGRVGEQEVLVHDAQGLPRLGQSASRGGQEHTPVRQVRVIHHRCAVAGRRRHGSRAVIAGAVRTARLPGGLKPAYASTIAWRVGSGRSVADGAASPGRTDANRRDGGRT